MKLWKIKNINNNKHNFQKMKLRNFLKGKR